MRDARRSDGPIKVGLIEMHHDLSHFSLMGGSTLARLTGIYCLKRRKEGILSQNS